MDIAYVIPAPPGDFAYKYNAKTSVLGRAEINVLDYVYADPEDEDFHNTTRDDFIGGLIATRDDAGHVSFSSYCLLDPSKWEGAYCALQDAFAKELVKRGLATMDQMEHLQ